MEPQETLSCVLFHDVTEEAGCMYATDSVTELLGWDPKELVQMSFFSLVHPEEVTAARNLHYELVQHDKAATLTYLRLLHKGEDVRLDHRGDDRYALCALSRSVTKNFFAGTISLATDDPGNTRAALATGGVFVLTPAAQHLAFRRLDTRVNLAEEAIFTGPPNGYPKPFRELDPPSDRVALLLDRFSHRSATVLHCSNDSVFPTEPVFKQDLFQFIPHESDKEDLTKTIDLVKRWITTSVDGPASGPFATCQFTLHVPPVQQKRVMGILIATSDAILATLAPLPPLT